MPFLGRRRAGHRDGRHDLVEQIEQCGPLRGVGQHAFQVRERVLEPGGIELAGVGQQARGAGHIGEHRTEEAGDVHGVS